MPILHAIVLGLVQGLSEFLPISSSGHLLLVPWFFGWNDFDDESTKKAFDVALHIGTIVAGGSAPYIAAQLVESTGNSMAPAHWVMAVALIGIVTVSTMRETGKAALLCPHSSSRAQKGVPRWHPSPTRPRASINATTWARCSRRVG